MATCFRKLEIALGNWLRSCNFEPLRKFKNAKRIKTKFCKGFVSSFIPMYYMYIKKITRSHRVKMKILIFTPCSKPFSIRMAVFMTQFFDRLSLF